MPKITAKFVKVMPRILWPLFPGTVYDKMPHAVSVSQLFSLPFLPRDSLQCKARSCNCMASVCLSVRLYVRNVGGGS